MYIVLKLLFYQIHYNMWIENLSFEFSLVCYDMYMKFGI